MAATPSKPSRRLAFWLALSRYATDRIERCVLADGGSRLWWHDRVTGEFYRGPDATLKSAELAQALRKVAP